VDYIRSSLPFSFSPVFLILSNLWINVNNCTSFSGGWGFVFQVAWVRVDTHSILTIHNKVITRNYRIGLAQADGRNWDLKISNAAENDRGFYMCQV
jgi:hypothetical protein